MWIINKREGWKGGSEWVGKVGVLYSQSPILFPLIQPTWSWLLLVSAMSYQVCSTEVCVTVHPYAPVSLSPPQTDVPPVLLNPLCCMLISVFYRCNPKSSFILMSWIPVTYSTETPQWVCFTGKNCKRRAVLHLQYVANMSLCKVSMAGMRTIDTKRDSFLSPVFVCTLYVPF